MSSSRPRLSQGSKPGAHLRQESSRSMPASVWIAVDFWSHLRDDSLDLVETVHPPVPVKPATRRGFEGALKSPMRLGILKPSGPHHLAISSGALNAPNT